MKSSEICALAINIVAGNYGDTTYRMGSTADVPRPYNNMTWYNGAWRSDCLGLLRAVLCGWNANKDVWYGGANIDIDDPNAYNCKWFSEIMFLTSCTIQSYDFSLLNIPCCMLYKTNPYGHVGLYVGEYQLNGYTYNVCECTSWYGDASINGCKPTWVDSDGTRRFYKNGPALGTPWLAWGQFNLNGDDYGITEYDGGAIGATGFGSELSETDVDYYWNTLNNLTYDYVESIADSIHGMSSDVFKVMAGWGWGEAYAYANPVGASEPDKYLAYLCDCIPVNYFEGLGITTGRDMANAIAGGGGAWYSYEALIGRGDDLKNNETSSQGQNELRALLLALLNPNQYSYFCNGYPTSYSVIIHQNDYPSEGTIYVFYYEGQVVTYDITGTGIRGGTPTPGSRGRKMPLYMMLRPYYNFNYRR